jgi:hypothetical protein
MVVKAEKGLIRVVALASFPFEAGSGARVAGMKFAERPGLPPALRNPRWYAPVQVPYAEPAHSDVHPKLDNLTHPRMHRALELLAAIPIAAASLAATAVVVVRRLTRRDY